jgi:hypothetical protein
MTLPGARGTQIGEIVGALKTPLKIPGETIGQVEFLPQTMTELRWPVMDVDMKDGSFGKTLAQVQHRSDLSTVTIEWWTAKKIREYEESNSL